MTVSVIHPTLFYPGIKESEFWDSFLNYIFSSEFVVNFSLCYSVVYNLFFHI